MTLTFDPGDLMHWSGGEWLPRPPVLISSVVHDTKQVVPGSLFVAIRGARFDGHDFVGQAAASGAAAAMVSHGRAASLLGSGLPLLVVEDPALALRDLASGYRRKLGLTVVGVTGSTGKTTVKEMIACLLESTMSTARTKGNWNNEIGLPLSILAIPPGTRAGVLELGISHPGEMAPLCGIARPDWGVITNVGPVHLEFFASVEDIVREKGELVRQLPVGGAAVLSVDDPYFNTLRELSCGDVVTTSLHRDAIADFVLMTHDSRSGECVVADRKGGGTHRFRMAMPGTHSRHNALLAVAVARGLGVEWDRIAAAFERYVGPPMRWERQTVAGVTIINDAYNANPVSMLAALHTFKELDVAGRKWLVLGDMLELGPSEVEEHRAVGQALGGVSWGGLVAVGTLGAHIAEGALAAGLNAATIHTCGDAMAAAEYLKDKIIPGDALLIKASRGKRLEEVVSRLKDTLGKG